jgi:hypothetical protein
MWCTEYQTGMCENTDKMANGQRKISEQHQQDLVGGGIKPFELKKFSRADIFKFRRSEIKPKTHGRDHNRVEEL